MENQVFYTVLSGTSVFVLGQILQKFILEPFQEYKKTIGRIDNRLKFYSNILTNAGFTRKIIVEVTDAMRNLSCDLEANYKQIPFNQLFVNLKLLESKKDMATAAQGLIFVSNAGGRRDSGFDRVDNRINEIRKLLKIESLN